MAKKEKELSVEDKLKTLYKMQEQLSEIDKIKILRGELPLEVSDLEDEIEGLNTRIAKYVADVKETEKKVAEQKQKIQECGIKVQKYKEQLENVRNNREFDHLSKEIEFESLEVELAEKHIREFNQEIKAIKEQIEKIKENLVEKKENLKNKKEKLNEIITETRQQEEVLRESVKKIEGNVEPRLLQAFKRIRKSMRNGLAVVCIERGACGGCFAKIPPQRQMDIKMGKKIIVCEFCGRIMVDPDLVATGRRKQDKTA